MGRRPCCEKVGLNRGGWSAPEDEILTNYIKANGEGNWRDLPLKAGLKRCGKSCRLRWFNYLNPKIIRGNITQEEEVLIIKLHKHLGNRWSLIAGHMPGRTDNEIKNYWNTILSRKVHGQQVHRRKRRKKTNGKNSNSNSLPRRRTTVLPTQVQSSNYASEPAFIASESTDALATSQPPVTPQESRTKIMCEIMHNMGSDVYEECYTPELLISSQENISEYLGDTLQNIANMDTPQCQVEEECCTPRQSVSSHENHTDFMGNIMHNIPDIEVPQSPLYEECYPPRKLFPYEQNDTEFMSDIMQNIACIEVPPSDVFEECYGPQQLVSSQGNNTEIMGDLVQIITTTEAPQCEVFEKYHTQQQSDPSEGESGEFMVERMQHFINSGSPHGEVYGKRNAQQQSDSSLNDPTDFMGGIMQDIVNIEFPENSVYGKSYHDQSSELGAGEIYMPNLDEYSVYTYEDLMSEHWMANTYTEQNNALDLLSSATLFEEP